MSGVSAEDTASNPATFGMALALLPLTVGCGNFMVNLDQNIVVTALPGIGQSLGRAPSELGLIITIYVLSLMVSMPLGGWLTERFGTKACYVGATMAFAAASIGCGLATGYWTLVIARVLQGFGGAVMGTVGQVAILRAFPRSKMLKINIYMSLASQLGPLVGPLVGGALTTYFSWHWIFFVNVPLSVLAAGLALSSFPPRTVGRLARLDLTGFMLVSSGMTLLVFSLDALGGRDGSTRGALLLLLLAAVALAVGVVYLLRTRAPLIDLRLLRVRTIRVSLVTGGGLDTIGMSAVSLLLPLMFQVGFGMTAVESGSWTFVIGLGSFSSRVFLPALLRRFGFRRLLVVNTPIMAAMTAGFALFQATTPMWFGLGYIFVFGLLRSVQWGTATNLSYVDVTAEQTTDFSAIYNIFWRLAVSISMGSAATMLSLLASHDGISSVGDFRLAFVIEALVTLCALLAYRSLAPDDGAVVSGHGVERAGD